MQQREKRIDKDVYFIARGNLIVNCNTVVRLVYYSTFIFFTIFFSFIFLFFGIQQRDKKNYIKTDVLEKKRKKNVIMI